MRRRRKIEPVISIETVKLILLTDIKDSGGEFALTVESESDGRLANVLDWLVEDGRLKRTELSSNSFVFRVTEKGNRAQRAERSKPS